MLHNMHNVTRGYFLA